MYNFPILPTQYKLTPSSFLPCMWWCAQQKVRELQKAQETVCYLQEQLDAAQTTPPPSVSVAELRRAEEEMRRSEMKMQVGLQQSDWSHF